MSDKLSMKSGKTLADVDGAEGAGEETAEKLESTLEPSDQEEDEEEEGSDGEEED